MSRYFEHCSEVVAEWRKSGPQTLSHGDPYARGFPTGREAVGEEIQHPHGVYLFKTRNEIVEYVGQVSEASEPFEHS